MATHKSMTAEAKARLAAAKEATAGRRSLRGYNLGGWGATLDEALNDGPDWGRACEAARSVSGVISRHLTARVSDESARQCARMGMSAQVAPDGWVVEVSDVLLAQTTGVKYRWKPGGKPDDGLWVAHCKVQWSQMIEWVQVRHASAIQIADLERAFPVRYVREERMVSLGLYAAVKVPLFRAIDMAALLFMLWPVRPGAGGTRNDDGWNEYLGRVRKYLFGYTIPAVHALQVAADWDPRPGVSGKNGGTP